MRLEKGELILHDVDFDHIQGDIDEGLTVAEAFENQVITLGGLKFQDIDGLRVHPDYYDLCRKIAGAIWGKEESL